MVTGSSLRPRQKREKLSRANGSETEAKKYKCVQFSVITDILHDNGHWHYQDDNCDYDEDDEVLCSTVPLSFVKASRQKKAAWDASTVSNHHHDHFDYDEDCMLTTIT